MANAARKDEVVELAEAPKPSGNRCETCAHFRLPPGQDPKKMAAVGGRYTGECHLQPMVVRKEPADVCGQHPAVLAAQQLRIFEPIIDKFAEALRRAK